MRITILSFETSLQCLLVGGLRNGRFGAGLLTPTFTAERQSEQLESFDQFRSMIVGDCCLACGRASPA
jgi:hypothetical protein